ncbi:hypothetical protein B0T18DRAFT_413138 [Schizothecium vesticola]|uniref:Thaumatin-like protein n=1 Tax=Schizothecium vesticola TaxID=314040 RepID=A0AA40K5X0_9PEZI|nr:hypothetical protein B0T18DRAFT_413138 [Schizothecium vesticola]
MTLTIANKAGRPVTTHHYHNAHTPTLPSPPAAPTPGVMADGQSMHYVVPLGYGGTMMVSAGEMLGQESQLEYTFETQDGINKVALDISYFKAYSFSMVCTCSDGVKTGCDIPLFAKHQCVSPDYVNAAGACVNAAPDAGPASPFFADCKDKAYVYTFNDLATNNGNCLTGDFTYEILPNGK